MCERTHIKGNALPVTVGNDPRLRGRVKLVTGILFCDRRAEDFLLGLCCIATRHVRDVPRVWLVNPSLAEAAS
jgi:hypothetical protein